MPAPTAALLAATRNGTASRHLFFTLEHPLSVVRVWNGIGDFVFGGFTFSGVGGLGAVSGISDSVEIQQHEITCTLNNVGISAMRADDGDVRGAPATIVAAMIDESGAVVYQRTMFTGVGDVLKSKIHDRVANYTLTLRSLLVDWSAAPVAYYTPQDQQRLFAGDTGFNYVKRLQDATVAGWSKNEESSGSYVAAALVAQPAANPTSGSGYPQKLPYALSADAALRAIGNATYGVCQFQNRTSATDLPTLVSGSGLTYEEYNGNGDSAPPIPDENDALYLYLAASLNAGKLYVDINGDVRTANGRLVVLSQDTALKLRLAGEITGNGTATATTLAATIPTGNNWPSGNRAVLHKTGTTPSFSTADWTTAVFCNETGGLMFADGSGVVSQLSFVSPVSYGTHTYVEDVSGTAAVMSGGTLKVSGSNCFVSTTGVILSSANRRIVRQGGTANQFLRVWT